MKRSVLFLIAAMLLTFAAQAQGINGSRNAIGIRGGWGAELSYQHTLGSNFVEADLGLYSFNAINVGATYNWMLAQPQWTDRGERGVYAGPGLFL